jgi:hypothetical protein
MPKSVNTKFVTDKVRFSFANVFEPAPNLSGVMKYSVSVLIPKSDKAGVARFNAAFEKVKQDNSTYWGATIPKTLKGGLRDGDTEREGDEVYAGHYFFNANSNERPGVVDADLNPITDKNEFYSGCYGRASVTMYPYDQSGSRGIAFGLNNVMKLEDGEKLGGPTSAAVDFAV